MIEYSSNLYSESESGLIDKFEDMIQNRTSCFFDVEEVEILADYYLDKGNHAKARKAIEHGLEIHPGSPAILLKKAQVFLMIKEPKKSLKILNYLEAAEPMNTELLLFKAVVHRNLSDHEGTKHCLMKALSYASENKEEIFLDLAFEQELAEDYSGAIESLIQSLEINPNHEASLFELGYCYDMAQELENGIEFFQNYLDKLPYSFVGWYNLALCFEKLSLFEKAIESVDFCLAIKEDFTNAYILKGNLYTSMDMDVQAIEAYTESLLHDDDNPMVFAGIGECYERMDQLEEAEANYKQALEIDPTYVDALMGMGAIKESQKDFVSCISYYREALNYDELNLDNWHILAEVLVKTDRLHEAKQAYQFMSKTFVDDEESWANLAQITAVIEDHNAAVEVIEEGLGFVTEANDLNWHLAKHLIQSGKLERATEILNEELPKSDDNGKFFLSIFPDAAQIPNIAGLIELYSQGDREDEF